MKFKEIETLDLTPDQIVEKLRAFIATRVTQTGFYMGQAVRFSDKAIAAVTKHTEPQDPLADEQEGTPFSYSIEKIIPEGRGIVTALHPCGLVAVLTVNAEGEMVFANAEPEWFTPLDLGTQQAAA